MKNLVFGIMIAGSLLAMSFTIDLTEEDKKGLGKAQKIDGIEVYVMSEPLREYEVVGTVGVYDIGMSQTYVDDWINKYVDKALKLKKDEGKTVDAIIYTSGKSATVIKWKEVK